MRLANITAVQKKFVLGFQGKHALDQQQQLKVVYVPTIANRFFM